MAGSFDNIDHGLLMKAVRKHVKERWQLLYIERWLNAPVQYRDGQQAVPEKGTPQGGVISPLLANLFLHYVFDVWVERNNLDVHFERYADDIVCHCKSEAQAKELKERLEERFQSCGLELQPEKTKIAYCKGNYRGHYPVVSFDFLGYTFGPRWIKTRRGCSGLYFVARISQKSAKRIRQEINSWPWACWVQGDFNDIRDYCYSRLKGWMNYYSLFGESIIRNVLFHFDKRLSRWAMKKYKKVKTIMQAAKRVNRARKKYWFAFPHWRKSFVS